MAFVVALMMALGTPHAYAASNTQQKKTTADMPVQVTADQLEYVKTESKIIGKGNVVVTYDDMKLTCDYAEVYSDIKKANAEGHVIMTRGTELMKGDKGSYDFANSQGTFPHGTFKNGQFYGTSETLEQVSAKRVNATQGSITTCDYQLDANRQPHYDVHASKVVIYPNHNMVARNVTIRILGKPDFWVPLLHIPLKDGHAPFGIQPGHSSQDGFYVLGYKRYSLAKNVKGKLHLDYRAKRGMGYGNDLNYTSNMLGQGIMKAYIIDDKNAPNDDFDKPYANKHNETRYRGSWKHRKDIGNTMIIGEINKLSDPYLLKDFFQGEYRNKIDPETYATVTHNEDNFGGFINVEKRINKFAATTERMPELQFNWNPQEIMGSNVFYKNETSAVSFNDLFKKSENGANVVRGDTFHEFSYPVRLEPVFVRPYVNYRGDYYSKNYHDGEDVTRNALGGGIDANTKFYRTFDVSTNALGLDINRLRHVFEPSIRYESVRWRTTAPEELEQIDAIDALDNLDKVQFGFDNRLQTKRTFTGSEKTVNVVSYNTYLTYRFHKESRDGSTWTTWDNGIEFRPYNWLLSEITSVYDVERSELYSVNWDIELFETDQWHIFFEERFLEDSTKLSIIDVMYKLNERWGLGGYVRGDFEGKDIIEEWEVRASRDLHCWLLNFGVNMRRSDIDSSNAEIFVELMMKGFPDYTLKQGNRASFSRMRMGNTVAGAETRYRDQSDEYGIFSY